MSPRKSLKPMSISLSVALFGLPAVLFLVLQQVVIPALDSRGGPLLLSYGISMLPHVLFLGAALLGFRLEGHRWRWSEVKSRFRLGSMKRSDWLWALLASAGNIGLYLSVLVLARPVVRWLYGLLPEPEALARVFGDGTTFAGYPLQDNAWLLGVFLVGYFFNVMGEELWWRGYIFPRQELTHGRHTWMVHGLLWAGFHLFAPFNAIMVLPGALLVSWIVQRRGNTWIFVIAHATMNGIVVVQLAAKVFAW